MSKRSCRYLVGDFETTVYKGQVNTEVWASAIVEIGTENVLIHHSIDDTFTYLLSLDSDIIIYYHNLKFDGSFWLSYLLVDLGYSTAGVSSGKDNADSFVFYERKNMRNKSIAYSISDMGQWYSILIKVDNHYIEIRDSLKLLPFSVKRIGESFGTKHKKLNMEYTGFRYAGCEITEDEKKYIANDVLVVKEALEIMFGEGHSKLTIGSCCLSEYKKIVGKYNYEDLFPDIYAVPVDTIHEANNAGDWVRKTYRGGWCYLAKGKERKKYHNGTTADVNSLYPSMMSSESGNIYPVGIPKFWYGNTIPKEAIMPNRYFFIHIKTRFRIKKNMLPFIQIKNNPLYKGTESLETSDIYSIKTGKYYPFYYDTDGVLQEAKVDLYLTMTDYFLILEHYDLFDCEIIDGCWFYAMSGIFDDYINKYKKIKVTSKGAKRELAKLFLNNLYGKMASSPRSNFKVAYVKEDKTIGFYSVVANDKIPGFIPVGSAITSYARNFTIRAAQKNYYGKNNRGFIYADTDSIHCDLSPEEIKGITVHPKDFCCWKLESCWDEGLFIRQKTYVEHITHEDLEPVDEPYYNIKCAGMPENCKKLFLRSMLGDLAKEDEDLDEEEREFLSKKRELEDFDIGLTIPGKLLPKRIRGGVLLCPTTYQMR